jgi:hypothetical protein
VGATTGDERVGVAAAIREWDRAGASALEQLWPSDPFLGSPGSVQRQEIDLGANYQMALDVRPAHDPVREYGFLGVLVDNNLEGSIWTCGTKAVVFI